MTNPNPQPFRLEDFRAEAKRISDRRKVVRENRVIHATKLAEAERDYRKELALAFARAKSNGDTATAADLQAHADAAGLRHTRDIAAAMVKADDHELSALEAGRAMLRVEADWSQRLSPTA